MPFSDGVAISAILQRCCHSKGVLQSRSSECHNTVRKIQRYVADSNPELEQKIWQWLMVSSKNPLSSLCKNDVSTLRNFGHRHISPEVAQVRQKLSGCARKLPSVIKMHPYCNRHFFLCLSKREFKMHYQVPQVSKSTVLSFPYLRQAGWTKIKIEMHWRRICSRDPRDRYAGQAASARSVLLKNGVLAPWFIFVSCLPHKIVFPTDDIDSPTAVKTNNIVMA